MNSSFSRTENSSISEIGSKCSIKVCSGLEWAHFVNACILAGEGTAERGRGCEEFGGMRGLLMLAAMSTKENMATGVYSTRCVQVAGKHHDFVLGFVANRILADSVGCGQDFLLFTTGVNRATRTTV
jgi:hypothetical protein